MQKKSQKEKVVVDYFRMVKMFSFDIDETDGGKVAEQESVSCLQKEIVVQTNDFYTVFSHLPKLSQPVYPLTTHPNMTSVLYGKTKTLHHKQSVGNRMLFR